MLQPFAFAISARKATTLRLRLSGPVRLHQPGPADEFSKHTFSVRSTRQVAGEASQAYQSDEEQASPALSSPGPAPKYARAVYFQSWRSTPSSVRHNEYVANMAPR